MVGLLTRTDYAGSKQADEDDDDKGKGKGRAAAKDEGEDKAKGDALLIVAKNRNGPTDDVHLTFIDHSMRFIEREAREDEKN